MKISNSMPRVDFRGIKDDSIRSVPPVDTTYPIHMPLFFSFAEKGTTDAYPGVGSVMVNMYGSDIANKTSKYATHVTPYIELCQKNANHMMIKRIIPDDAPAPSRIRLCLEVEQNADINVYSRDEFGNVQYDVLQQPIVTGTRKGTKLRWLTLQDALRGSLVEDTAPVSGDSLRNANGLISALASTSETQVANLAETKEIALSVISNSEEISEVVREPYKTKINNAATISEVKTVLKEFNNDLMDRVNLITNLSCTAGLSALENMTDQTISMIRNSDHNSVKTVLAQQVASIITTASNEYSAYYTSFRSATKSFDTIANKLTSRLLDFRNASSYWERDSFKNSAIYSKFIGENDSDKLSFIETNKKLYEYIINAGLQPTISLPDDDHYFDNAMAVKLTQHMPSFLENMDSTRVLELLDSEIQNPTSAENKKLAKKCKDLLPDAKEFFNLVEETKRETPQYVTNLDNTINSEIKNLAQQAQRFIGTATDLSDHLLNGFENIANSCTNENTPPARNGTTTITLSEVLYGILSVDKPTDVSAYHELLTNYSYDKLKSLSGDILSRDRWADGFKPLLSDSLSLKDFVISAGEQYYIPVNKDTPLDGLNLHSTSLSIADTLPDGALKTHCVTALSTSAIADPNDANNIILSAFAALDNIPTRELRTDDNDTVKAVIKSSVNTASIYRNKINDVLPHEDETEVNPDDPGGTVVVKPTRPVTEAEINRVLMSDIGSLKPFVGKNSKAKVYPIIDLEVTWRGAYGNNCGIGMFASNQDTDLIKEMGTHTYSFTVWNRESKFATPVKVRSIYSAESFKFTLNPNARDPISSALYDLQQIMLNQYRDLNTSGGQEPTYGDFNDLHVYEDNVELIQKLVYNAEAAENTEVASYANKVEHPEYIVNIIDGRDLGRNPYHTFDVVSLANDADGYAIDWSDTTRIFAAGGGDGTINAETYDTLVRRELDHFGELDVMFEDMAQYPFGQFYDTGFTSATKKSIFKILSKRPDVNVTMSVFDGKVRRDLSEIFSIATMLNSVGANYIESETYGTPLTRAVLVAQTGELIGEPSYTKPLSVAYELMNMRSNYMGNPEGNLRTGFEYDEAPGNRVKLLKNITNPSMLATTRSMLWGKNVTYFQYSARNVLFCPAVQTMYSNETSVLRSDINMQICCDLNKVAFKVWTEITGRNISNAKLCDLSNRRISEITSMKYGSRVIITPDTFITAIDKARGWSWTTHIHGEFANMKTVNDLTIISHRLTEDE